FFITLFPECTFFPYTTLFRSLQGFSALAAPAELGVDQSPAGEATCLRHRNPSALRSLSVSGTQPSLSVAPCISDLVTNCNLCRKKPCDQGFYPSGAQPSGSSRDHSIICSRCFRHRPALDVAGSPHSGLWLPHERALRQHRCMALPLNMVTEPRPGQAGGSPSEHDTDSHPPRRGQAEALVQPCCLQLPHLGRQRLVLRPRVVEPDERPRRESPPEVVELLHPQVQERVEPSEIDSTGRPPVQRPLADHRDRQPPTPPLRKLGPPLVRLQRVEMTVAVVVKCPADRLGRLTPRGPRLDHEFGLQSPDEPGDQLG